MPRLSQDLYVIGAVVYGIVGWVVQEVYATQLNKANTSRVTASERTAVAALWWLFLAGGFAIGVGRLLLRAMAIPRKTQNAINQARVEAKGTSLVASPREGPIEADYIEQDHFQRRDGTMQRYR